MYIWCTKVKNIQAKIDVSRPGLNIQTQVYGTTVPTLPGQQAWFSTLIATDLSTKRDYTIFFGMS